jgi:hypothetical protein
VLNLFNFKSLVFIFVGQQIRRFFKVPPFNYGKIIWKRAVILRDNKIMDQWKRNNRNQSKLSLWIRKRLKVQGSYTIIYLMVRWLRVISSQGIISDWVNRYTKWFILMINSVWNMILINPILLFTLNFHFLTSFLSVIIWYWHEMLFYIAFLLTKNTLRKSIELICGCKY